MKKEDKEVLLRIAEAVTDGSAVDWGAEIDAHAGLRGRLARLRAIEKVAVAHQGSQLEAVRPLEKVAEAATGDFCTGEVAPGAVAPSQWGHLRIIGQIGQGAYSEVFRAHDPKLQIDVALKLLRSDRHSGETEIKRFLDEARRLARVRHSNVLVVHGADRHDGRAGLWTDLLDGMTLENRLQEQGLSSPNEAALIGIDLCGALAAVHATGLVHLDVKTANVMREKGGRIVLMDFSSVREPQPQRAGTAGDSASGTPLFMAPELFRGEDAGTAADIYSLGVVLYRLVTGGYPVSAGSFDELRDKHRREESVALRDARPDLPAPFVEVVERALAPDPGRRYKTVGEMERALRTALGSLRQPDPDPALPWWRRRAAVIAAAASTVVAAIVIVSLWPVQFQVKASLYRVGNGTEERLLPGAMVVPGDRLFLEIEGSREMHVYVLNEDQAGEAFVLFPLPDLDVDNPLPGRVVHRLPGAVSGADRYWEVSSAGGRETFLVIASMEPLTETEADFADVPRAGEAVPVELSQTALRGIGGLVGDGPPGEQTSSPPLSAISRSLSGRAATTSGIWLWEIQLNNPRADR